MPQFPRLKRFVLVIGNSRSGSTLLGSILDAHPNALVANETAASATFWRNLDREQILAEIQANSARNRESGRISEGYRYLISAQTKHESDVLVVGDKVWNPATLLLHGDHALLPRLEALIGVPILIIHAIRNPFDVIATMHARSKAPLSDRMAWYFMHCDAALAVRERWDRARHLDFHHESFYSSPEESIRTLCEFAGLAFHAQHLEACKAMLFAQPRQTRFNIKWQPEMVRQIRGRMKEYDFLAKYADEDHSQLTA